MSGGLKALSPTEDDISKLLMAGAHLGAKNCIVAVENSKDVCAISARPYGTRAVLKFAHHVGATAIAGRFTPGTFTNQIQKAFQEPRVLVVTDPRTDHQPIREGSYVNVPVIALANTDSPMRYIDIAIPCNNKSVNSIGLLWWLLAREVLRLRGTISRESAWDVMPDLYFYRDPTAEEAKEEVPAIAAAAETEAAPAAAEEWSNAPAAAAEGEWNAPAAGAEWGAQ